MTKRRKTQRDISGEYTKEEIKPDNTPIVHQNTKLKASLNIFERPLTENQKKFMGLALSKEVNMLIVSGPAGTSKTYLAVLASLMLINKKKISDILYIRSVVESSDVKMGYLPGEKDSKMSPYMQPLMDKLDELLPAHDVKRLQTEKRVESLPVGYLRGLNWNTKAIIGDECQNLTTKELITLMTRVGEFSKLFLVGDPTQSDLNGKSVSGFKKIYDLFNDEESRQNGIYTFEFTEEDIVRSALVRFIAKKIKNLS
jgi:phosphate starvation-inducible protein PhoH and related proteins